VPRWDFSGGVVGEVKFTFKGHDGELDVYEADHDLGYPSRTRYASKDRDYIINKRDHRG
jgi:hypothetical protein